MSVTQIRLKNRLKESFLTLNPDGGDVAEASAEDLAELISLAVIDWMNTDISWLTVEAPAGVFTTTIQDTP